MRCVGRKSVCVCVCVCVYVCVKEGSPITSPGPMIPTPPPLFPLFPTHLVETATSAWTP